MCTRSLAATQALLIAIAGVLASCSFRSVVDSPAATEPVKQSIVPPSLADETPRDYPGIHNAVAYHDGFVSGSAPVDDAGFDTLAGMGIKTIISVDGAAPDVAAARARGIRYIHLPIGYNGFDEQRKLELVRATRDGLRDGLVYIHCHHGKHRSAGAAAAISASMGWMSPEAAIARMKVSGTAANYKGLYACAATSLVLTSGSIDAVPADFPEVSHPAGFVKAMVEIDEINERLKVIEKAGWTVPSDHPDLVPAAEAGRMADLLRVASRGYIAQSKPAEFASMLMRHSKEVQTLEDMLTARVHAKLMSAQFSLIGSSCKDCHAKYRD